MPRLTLPRKLFLALSGLLLSIVLVFLALTRWGLQHSLGDFVAEIELSRMDWLNSRLAQRYAEQGSWAFLSDEPDAWSQLLRRRPAPREGDAALVSQGAPSGPPGALPRGPNPGGGPGQPPGPPFDRSGPPAHRGDGPPGPPSPGDPQPHPQPPSWPPRPESEPPPRPRGPGPKPADGGGPDSVYPRLVLLGPDGQQRLAGAVPSEPLAAALRSPIDHQGRTVGYLAVLPLRHLGGQTNQAFLAQQLQFALWAGGVGLLLALLISWRLSQRWLRPITALIQAAQQVARGQPAAPLPTQGDDELAALSQTFNHMNLELASVEASRQRWLSDVAHELRTPLAAMRAEIEALQDGIRPFNASTTERLHRQVMRLGQLVDDLRLSLHEPDAPALPLPDTVQPLPLLKESVDWMRERFAQAGLRLTLDPLCEQAPTHWQLPGDERRLQQVFMNLLENSLRYTQAGGQVHVSAEAVGPREGSSPPEGLWLHVDDSAPAPRADELQRLTERFYRADSSRNRALGGSGLGLSIVQRLVEAHGGRLTLTLSALGGLRASLYLPLNSKAPTPPGPTSQAAQAPSHTP